MFKAHYQPSGGEILILDRRWVAQVDYLRALAVQDALVCPGCRQPVRVRAGQVKRWHFAHKHLENCPFGTASPTLLKMRACLYDWLVSKFGDKAVTVEKWPSEKSGFHPIHPIDCWVEGGDRTFAYWFFDRRMPPDERYNLSDGFEALGVPVTWVFAADLLRVDQTNPKHRIHTTTTERAFLTQTTFDPAWRTHMNLLGSSLHYLDPDQRTLTTYRDLKVVHKPQLYAGTRLHNSLDKIRVSTKNGEFIHPGEPEQLEVKLREHEQQQQVIENRLAQADAFFKRISEKRGAPTYSKGAVPLSQPFARQGTCRICGKVTADWVTYFGETKECICRDCKGN